MYFKFEVDIAVLLPQEAVAFFILTVKVIPFLQPSQQEVFQIF